MPKPPAPVRAGDVRGRVRASRKQRDGRWYWVAERWDGRRDVTVGAGWHTHREAKAWIVEVAAGVAGAPRSTGDGVASVRDLLAAYLGDVEARADIKAGTRRAITRHVYAFTGVPEAKRPKRKSVQKTIAGTIGDVLLERVGRANLERHRNLRLAAGYAARTVREELRVLRTAWTWARDVGLTDVEPPPVPDVLGGPVRNRRTPTAADVAKVLPHLPRDWHRDAVRLLWATGARVGELAELRVRDVRLADLLVVVDGKTGPREVPIERSTAARLRPYVVDRHPDARLWGVVPHTVTEGLPDQLAAACAAAGVPRFTPHGLRRAAVDRMARAGVDVAAAASITGHSVTVMLRYYRTVTDADRRDAVARARLGALPEGKVLHLAAGHNSDSPPDNHPDDDGGCDV